MRATRTYLEMRDAAALRAARWPQGHVRLERLDACPPAFYRFLYAEVGRAYYWTDRAGWTDEDASAHLARPDISVWLLSEDDAPAGYFELQRHPDGSTEIAYFGLLPGFIGRGLGGWLLSEAVREAWATRPCRVWLHTSTLDHRAALANYLARGFHVMRTEDYDASTEPIPGHLGEPGRPPGP